MSYELGIANADLRLKIADCRLQIAHCQLLIANCILPIVFYPTKQTTHTNLLVPYHHFE